MKRKNPYGDGKDRIAKVIIALFIIFIIAILNAGSYKPLVYKIFNDYEEKCYEYKKHYWNETYCESSMGFMDWKNTNKEHPCCDNETFEFTWDNGTKAESRWCMGSPFEKPFWEYTDECDTYHLVRKSGEITLPSATFKKKGIELS